MAHKAIFLDRDNTIISDPGYINDPAQVKLLDGAAESIIQLRKMGYKIIVVSNQAGVARGIIPENALAKIHERLTQLLAEKDAHLDNIYYCPYHPEGAIKKYRKESNMRKPAPGMLLAAAEEMDIDLSLSWMIGDAYSDVGAGVAAGCKTILLRTHSNRPIPALDDPKPDYEAINVKEAVNIVKREIAQTFSKAEPEPDEPKKSPPLTPHVVATPLPPIEDLPTQPAPVVAKPLPVANTRMPDDKRKEINDLVLEAKTETPRDSTEQVLVEIRSLLKIMHRDKTFSDFSSMKMAAIILQILVLFCLMMAIWQKMSPAQDVGAVFTALGFAIVFQLMALTLYIVNDRR